MREIKFRGKTICEQPRWAYGSLIQYEDVSADIHGIDIFKDSENSVMFTQVDQNTIGQFTGLKDNNGVEIYEGDIVVVTNLMVDGFDEQMLTSIVYDEELACFDFKASDRQRCVCTSVLDVELEVIGNIFDNPELLEKE